LAYNLLGTLEEIAKISQGLPSLKRLDLRLGNIIIIVIIIMIYKHDFAVAID
jgi:hypothetical protein